MAKKSWDERVADLFERILAKRVAGEDPSSLQEEMKRLLAEKPAEKSK